MMVVTKLDAELALSTFHGSLVAKPAKNKASRVGTAITLQTKLGSRQP